MSLSTRRTCICWGIDSPASSPQRRDLTKRVAAKVVDSYYIVRDLNSKAKENKKGLHYLQQDSYDNATNVL